MARVSRGRSPATWAVEVLKTVTPRDVITASCVLCHRRDPNGEPVELRIDTMVAHLRSRHHVRIRDGELIESAQNPHQQCGKRANEMGWPPAQLL
jgi:hypothetical protein